MDQELWQKRQHEAKRLFANIGGGSTWKILSHSADDIACLLPSTNPEGVHVQIHNLAAELYNRAINERSRVR